MSTNTDVAENDVAPVAERVAATGAAAKGGDGGGNGGLVVFVAGHALRQGVGMLTWVGDLIGAPMETGDGVRGRVQADEAAASAAVAAAEAEAAAAAAAEEEEEQAQRFRELIETHVNLAKAEAKAEVEAEAAQARAAAAAAAAEEKAEVEAEAAQARAAAAAAAVEELAAVAAAAAKSWWRVLGFMSLLVIFAFVAGLVLGASNRGGVCEVSGGGVVEGERKWPARLLSRLAGGSSATIASEPRKERCVFSFEPNVGLSLYNSSTVCDTS